MKAARNGRRNVLKVWTFCVLLIIFGATGLGTAECASLQSNLVFEDENPALRELAERWVSWREEAKASCPKGDSPVHVKIIGINDFHGQITAGKYVGGRPVGSAPILAASLNRSPAFPNLLVRAIGEEHRDLIVTAEREFRRIAAMLGGTLMLSEEEAIQALSDQMAELGAEYLRLYGIELDAASLRPLAEVGIRQAIAICEDDYLEEIRATIRFVEENLAARGIRY